MEDWLGMAAENSLTNLPCCSVALSEQSLCLRAGAESVSQSCPGKRALAMSFPFLVGSSHSP